MKNFNLRHLALCLIAALCVGSCRYNDDDIIYTPLYQFNYYLTNNIDTTITFCFNQYDRSTGFPPSEHTVVLAPATSGKLYGLMVQSGFKKTDSTTVEQPVITPEEASTIVLWNPREKDSNTITTTYLLIGDTKRDFDLESDKLPFYTKNYKVEIEQDTIFNFYFSVDSAFVQTLK